MYTGMDEKLNPYHTDEISMTSRFKWICDNDGKINGNTQLRALIAIL